MLDCRDIEPAFPKGLQNLPLETVDLGGELREPIVLCLPSPSRAVQFGTRLDHTGPGLGIERACPGGSGRQETGGNPIGWHIRLRLKILMSRQVLQPVRAVVFLGPLVGVVVAIHTQDDELASCQVHNHPDVVGDPDRTQRFGSLDPLQVQARCDVSAEELSQGVLDCRKLVVRQLLDLGQVVLVQPDLSWVSWHGSAFDGMEFQGPAAAGPCCARGRTGGGSSRPRRTGVN